MTLSTPAPTVLHDVLDPARATALSATLSLDRPGFQAGDALPPFFHQIYFWAAEPPARLGRDGHPKVGGAIPDMGLPRRMWAGGRLRFHAPLRVGRAAEKRTTVMSATHKVGRTGPLGFVTLLHAIWQDGACCVEEEQDLVYREEADASAPPPVPPPARRDADTTAPLSANSTTLFRYSALTFNGHRIHYDRDYARSVEGYPGLVVHGPLLAQHLMLYAVRELGPLSVFAFRATAPLIDEEAGLICRSGTDLWVAGPDGRQCMMATATPV